MKNIILLTKFTIREAFARKIFIAFAALSTFTLLVFLLLFLSLDVTDMSGVINHQGGEAIQSGMIAQIAEALKMLIIAPLYGGGLFLSIFSAASFIPNMLEKGNIDLLLSKPVSRSQIIWGKFIGGFLVVFVNIAYLVVGIWLLIGFKFGAWDTSILSTIFSISFTFAVLYSLIILIGILTRSSIFAMMVSYIIFFILSPLLASRGSIAGLIDNSVVEWMLDAFYYIVPQTSELGTITFSLATGSGVGDYQPIVISFLFMILTLALSIITFSKKDY